MSTGEYSNQFSAFGLIFQAESWPGLIRVACLLFFGVVGRLAASSVPLPSLGMDGGVIAALLVAGLAVTR
jgi:hypothetical protein